MDSKRLGKRDCSSHLSRLGSKAIPWLQKQGCTIRIAQRHTPSPGAAAYGAFPHPGRPYAPEPEIIAQQYSGRLLKPHPRGPNKSLYASEWLQTHGLVWKDAIALANDWQDRFLLNRATPVVVHPSPRLFHLAQKKRLAHGNKSRRQLDRSYRSYKKTLPG